MSFQDSRGLHMLPQAPEEASYYTYGTPSAGLGQYAHPNMLSFLFNLEFRWGRHDDRKLGFGNISLADSTYFEGHKSHRDGLDIDIRPVRKDGKHMPVEYQQAAYDRAATRRLVELIWQCGHVDYVYFNDLTVPRVVRKPFHDNHLHVRVRG